MSGSVYGKLFRVSTWGESHGPGIGVVIDGCPAGLKLNSGDIQKFLDRRKPGQSRYTTQRKESDEVEILSGVMEGLTTGAPISLLIRNSNQRSGDYDALADLYRPGHADYTYSVKYGVRDHRGGGRSSGRETIGRVAAGAVAAKLLAELGIQVTAFAKAIGPVTLHEDEYDFSQIEKNPFRMPDSVHIRQVEDYLQEVSAARDSVGGIIECRADGCPAGLGDPVFDKLDAELAKAVMSIGAVKGVEIGDGFSCASATGFTDNDMFRSGENGKVIKATNHAGGILGGISDGSCIILRAAVKPTPSIAREQNTVTKDGEETTISIKGRHDPIIVPRAVVVVESMVSIVLADALLNGASARVDYLRKIWER